MKEAFLMWNKPRMIAVTIACALLYGFSLALFKDVLVLIPDYSEVRSGNMFPLVFGLLFGPAGAWGSAFGNLIGDFYGTLTKGSFFGFLGNFLVPYLGYRLWGHFGRLSCGKYPQVKNVKNVLEYMFLAVLTAICCGVFIGWGVDFMNLLSFKDLALTVTLNQLFGNVIGILLFALISSEVKAAGLFWKDIMPKKTSEKPLSTSIGLILAWSGGVLALILGSFVFTQNATFITGVLTLIMVAGVLLV